jgi:hypothetical protein
MQYGKFFPSFDAMDLNPERGPDKLGKRRCKWNHIQVAAENNVDAPPDGRAERSKRIPDPTLHGRKLSHPERQRIQWCCV